MTNYLTDDYHDLHPGWNTVCASCMGDGYGPMIDNAIWKLITSESEHYLCRACMEHRLGRPLTNLDLQPKTPCNSAIVPDLCQPRVRKENQMKFIVSVTRTVEVFDCTEVEATSEAEAIGLAKEQEIDGIIWGDNWETDWRWSEPSSFEAEMGGFIDKG